MMPSGQTQFSVDFNWKISLAAAIFVPVLLGLGYWQLERAEHKRQLLAEFDQHLKLAPVDIDTQDLHALKSHQAVTLTGSFNQQQWFLLDNRVRRGRAGFEVLAPFYTLEGNWILVNRGWVEAKPLRTDLPEVAMPRGEVTLRGRLRLAQEDFVLTDDIAEGDGWPRVVQTENIAALNPLLDNFAHHLGHFSVRLDADDPAALEAGWPLVNTSPHKHTGYAVQWFAMAATLVVLTIFANTNLWTLLTSRRKNAGGETEG